MKNVIVVHGCPSDVEKSMNSETRTYDKHWMPWLKQQLTDKGIQINTPLMPEPWYPDYEKFKAEFNKYPVTEGTILIGHSCGCAFLVRWLGEAKQKVTGLILVAPWKVLDEDDNKDEYRKNFYGFPIDETIKEKIGKVIMFTSDNEEEVGKQSLKIYNDALGGEVIELKGRGHFTMKDMGVQEFPELLEKILEM